MEWLVSFHKTKQNKKTVAAPAKGSCGEPRPATVMVGLETEAWMNLHLEYIWARHLPLSLLTPASNPSNSYGRSDVECFLVSFPPYWLPFFLSYTLCWAFLSVSAQFNFMCLIGKKKLWICLFEKLLYGAVGVWAVGELGSSEDSLTDLKRPLRRFEILLEEQFPSPDFTFPSHHPTSSPSLHFQRLCPGFASFLYLMVPTPFFSISSPLISFTLLKAFMSLFLLPLLVSYSITIISLPSRSIYHRGYGALRHFLFFFFFSSHTCL